MTTPARLAVVKVIVDDASVSTRALAGRLDRSLAGGTVRPASTVHDTVSRRRPAVRRHKLVRITDVIAGAVTTRRWGRGMIDTAADGASGTTGRFRRPRRWWRSATTGSLKGLADTGSPVGILASDDRAAGES